MTVPAGYTRLPRNAKCTCPRMYQDADGIDWCCGADFPSHLTLPAVAIEVPLRALSALMTASRECAEELAAEIDAKYPLRHEQPVQKRRHERDMQVVQRVMDALGAIPKWTTP